MFTFLIEDLRNLRWPYDSRSDVDGATDSADNEQHCEATDVLEETHRNQCVWRAAVSLPESEGDQQNSTRY